MNGRSPARLFALLGAVVLLAVVGTISAVLFAIGGADISCGLGGGSAAAAGPAPTKAALRQIPEHWLTIYREAGSTLDISWPFLASIGWQECGDGSGACHGVNPSGCAGPMEIAYVRGSPCSPDESVPTIWERFRTDGNGDGVTSIFDPADAVFTAAKILRDADGAPPAGGSYAAYHEAACNYYGACSDPSANYAAEVMARAVEYGFGDPEAEAEPGQESEAGHPGPEGKNPTPGPAEPTTPVEPRGGRRAGGRGAHGGAPPTSGPACEASVVSTAGSGEIVRVAESQLGYHEHGWNCQKYGPCEEWCALFVAWVWERAGVPLDGGPANRAYSGFPWEWVKQHGGRDLPPTATPAPGDAILYGEVLGEMEHVGIVARVFPDGEITTIEGNFDNRVAEVGPFDPEHAEAAGEPGPVFGYAEPPTLGSEVAGGVERPHGAKKHRGGVKA